MELIISTFLTCVVVNVCHSYTSSKSTSDEEEFEPGTIVTESHRGGYDNQLVVDFTSYDGPLPAKKASANHPLPFAPTGHQLGPTVPAVPRGNKYVVVPSKQSTNISQQIKDIENYRPTLPTDFEKEISGFRIPYASVPSYLSSIEGQDQEDTSISEEGDNHNEEIPNHDQYFINDFLEPPEFNQDTEATEESEVEGHSSEETRDIIRTSKEQRTKRRKPVRLTKYRAIDNDPFERYEVHEFVLEKEKPPVHKVQKGVRPTPPRCDSASYKRPNHIFPHHDVFFPNNFPLSDSYHRHPRVRFYPRFPSRPSSSFRYPLPSSTSYPFHHSPLPLVRPSSTLVYSSSSAFRRPLTPTFHPLTPRPLYYRRPVPKSPHTCSKPQQIIKEVHFHHYNPSDRPVIYDVDDHENFQHESVNLKLVDDSNRLEDDVHDHHNDYSEGNESSDEEIDDFKKETEARLKMPEYYGDAHRPYKEEESYPPYHSESKHQPIQKYSNHGYGKSNSNMNAGNYSKPNDFKYYHNTT